MAATLARSTRAELELSDAHHRPALDAATMAAVLARTTVSARRAPSCRRPGRKEAVSPGSQGA
jgi:hypothetical protein